MKSTTENNAIITKDDIDNMRSLANTFAGTLHHDYQRDAFNQFANSVIEKMNKISKHVNKMNHGWNGEN